MSADVLRYARLGLPFAPAILGLLIVLWTSSNLWRPRLPNGFHLPGVALEFARNTCDIANLKREAPDVVEKPRLGFDDFVVVPLYVAVLAGLGASMSSGAMPVAGIGAALCAVGAGGFDWLENHRLRVVLCASAEGTLRDASVQRARAAAVGKWALLAGVMTLLGIGYLSHSGWMTVPAVAFLLSASVFGVGLYVSPQLVEWGFFLMGAALCLTAVPLFAHRFSP